MAREHTDHVPSRRKFVKRAAYVAPAVLSLAAVSAYAKDKLSGPVEKKPAGNPVEMPVEMPVENIEKNKKV